MSDDGLDEALTDLLWAPDLALPAAPDTPLMPFAWLQTAPEAGPSRQEPWDELDMLLAAPDVLDVELALEASSAAPTPTRLLPACPLPDERCVPPKRRSTAKSRIQLLRTEVERLQLDLEAARRQSPGVMQASTPIASTDRVLASQAGQMWQAIAARQQQRREQAETDNKWLRGLVLAQRRHLLNVRRLLGKRPHRNEVEAEANKCAAANTLKRVPFQSDRVFFALLEQLDAQYARVDQLWTESRVSELPCPGRRCLTSAQHVREETTFAFINRVNVPFELKAVERAMWRYLEDPRLRSPTAECAQLVGERGDTVQLSVTMTRRFDEHESTNTLRVVSRKFVERGRTVFVTQSLSKPRVAGDAAMQGVQFLTTTVRVVRPGGLQPTGGRSTVTESLWSARGFDADGVSKCPVWKLEPYIEVGIRALDATLTQEHNVLEDLLMERPSA